MDQFSFTGPALDGETSTVERDGFVITATIHDDPDAGKPWEREDGHGTVSEWTTRPKLAGELVLADEGFTGGNKRFYDFAEACRIALLDGWGVKGGQREGETAKAYAARAARADFERLRDWCADGWRYVGVAVTVSRLGVELVGEYAHALWGIEDDCPDYLAEVAEELAAEALDAARAKLAELTA